MTPACVTWSVDELAMFAKAVAIFALFGAFVGVAAARLLSDWIDRAAWRAARREEGTEL